MKFSKRKVLLGITVLLLIGAVVVYMIRKPKPKPKKLPGDDPGPVCFDCCGMNAAQTVLWFTTDVCTTGQACCDRNTFINTKGEIVTPGCFGPCCNTDYECMMDNTPCPANQLANRDGDCCDPFAPVDRNTGKCCQATDGLDSYGDCCNLTYDKGCCTPADWIKSPLECQYMSGCDVYADAPANKCCVSDKQCILTACNNDKTCAKNVVNNYCQSISQYAGTGECCVGGVDLNGNCCAVGIDSNGNCCDVVYSGKYGCCTPDEWQNNFMQCFSA